MSFVCPKCGMESHHPEDEAAGYCGACHDFTGRDDMIVVELATGEVLEAGPPESPRGDF